MLQFRNFQKSYGDKLIVAVGDLRLNGPFYWLRGGNGSGKTTLLQSIAGIIPFKGSIELNGKTAQQQPIDYRLAVSISMAEPQYPDFLTGLDLIQLYAETKRGSSEQAKELVQHFGIGDFVGDKTGTYSSGMKKKLSLVLAFIGRSEWILLDEPLITLDTASLALLLQLMEQRMKQGTHLLITSHQDVRLPFEQAPEALTISNHRVIRVSS